MALKTNTLAPDFTLKTKNAEGLHDITLSSFQGKSNVVLLFFPGAFTGPCTEEMCEVSSGLAEYKDLNAQVFGISCDTAFSQEVFAQQNNIAFPLLSDYAHKVTELYDVVLEDLAGLGPASKRAAFVIDKEGKIQYSEETPSPLEFPSFDQIIETLKSLD